MVQGELTITRHVHIYRHIDEEKETFQKALEKLSVKEADIKVHQEAQRDFLVYRNLLEEIGDEYAIVMVKSLESICNGREFVPDELKTLMASRVVFLVMDYPVMLTKIDLETNHMFLQLLMEVYTRPKAKLAELRAEKSKRLGRRKIGYPENWSELYDKWKAGEITGRDFMKATGLKRGTFYHMAAEYEEYMKSESIDQEQYGKK